MDMSIFIVAIFGVLFCIGGPILTHYVTKASEKAEREEKIEVKIEVKSK